MLGQADGAEAPAGVPDYQKFSSNMMPLSSSSN